MNSDFPVSSPTLLRNSIVFMELLFRDGFLRSDETRQIKQYQTGPAIDLVADAVAAPALSGAGASGGATAYSYAAIPNYPLVPGPGQAASPLGTSSTVVVNNRTIAGFMNQMPGKSPRGAAPGTVGAPLWDDRRLRRYGLPPTPAVTTLASAYAPTIGQVTIGGTAHTGDVVTITINGIPVAYTLVSADNTTTKVASKLVTAITNAAIPYISAALSATGSSVIDITGGGFTFTLSAAVTGAGATTTATANEPTSEPQTVTATIGGTFTAGNVLTVTINGTAVNYTVVSGDTNNAGAAASFAAAITAAGIAGVSAEADAAVITISGPITTITRTNPANMTITLGALQGPFVVSEGAGIYPGSWLLVGSGPTTVRVVQAVQTVLVPYTPALPNAAAAGTIGVTQYSPGSQKIAVEYGGYIAVGDSLVIGNVGAANRETVTVTAVSDPTQGAGLPAQYTFTATLANSHNFGELVTRARLVTDAQVTFASGAAVTGVVGKTTAGNATLSAANPIVVTAPSAGNITGVLFDIVKVSPTTGAILGAVALGVAAGATATDNGNVNTTTTSAVTAPVVPTSGTMGVIGAQVVGMTALTSIFVGQYLTIDTGAAQEVVQVLAINTTASTITALFQKAHSSGATVTGSNLIPYTPTTHSEVGYDAQGAVYQAVVDTLAISA